MTAEDLKLARTLIADPSWTRDAIGVRRVFASRS
jgi:hypothetical protein